MLIVIIFIMVTVMPSIPVILPIFPRVIPMAIIIRAVIFITRLDNYYGPVITIYVRRRVPHYRWTHYVAWKWNSYPDMKVNISGVGIPREGQQRENRCEEKRQHVPSHMASREFHRYPPFDPFQYNLASTAFSVAGRAVSALSGPEKLCCSIRRLNPGKVYTIFEAGTPYRSHKPQILENAIDWHHKSIARPGKGRSTISNRGIVFSFAAVPQSRRSIARTEARVLHSKTT